MSTNQDLKKVLKDCLDLEERLIDAFEESIEESFFGDEKARAKGIFRDALEGFDQCWYIPNFKDIKRAIDEDNKAKEERKKKQEEAKP